MPLAAARRCETAKITKEKKRDNWKLGRGQARKNAEIFGKERATLLLSAFIQMAFVEALDIYKSSQKLQAGVIVSLREAVSSQNLAESLHENRGLLPTGMLRDHFVRNDMNLS